MHVVGSAISSAVRRPGRVVMNPGKPPREPAATRVLSYLCAALIALIAIFLSIQVIGRYALRNPPEWTEELARVAFVYATFLGGALAVARRAHLGIDLLTLAMPTRPRALFQVAWRILACVVLVIVAWKGYELVERLWNQPLTSVPFSKGFMFAAVPIGLALTLIYEIGRIVAEWRIFVTGADPHGEDEIVGRAKSLIGDRES